MESKFHEESNEIESKMPQQDLEKKKIISALVVSEDEKTKEIQEIKISDDSWKQLPSDCAKKVESETSPYLESKLELDISLCTAQIKETDDVNKTASAEDESKQNESDVTSTPPRRSKRISINKKMTPQARQTPMGLPKPSRLNKKEFSLDEIYTNKNYHTPKPKSWPTIYEEPKVTKGGIRMVDKRQRKRAIEFYTVPAERPVKKRSRDCERMLRKKANERKKRRFSEGGTSVDDKLKNCLEKIDEDDDDDTIS